MRRDVGQEKEREKKRDVLGEGRGLVAVIVVSG